MLVDSGFFKTVSTQDRRPWWPKQTLPIVRTECWNADFEICITLVQITNAWIFMLIRRLTNHLHYFVYHCRSKQFKVCLCEFIGGMELEFTKFVGSSITAFSSVIISSRIWDFCDQNRNYSGALKNNFMQLKCTVIDMDNLSIRKIKGGNICQIFLIKTSSDNLFKTKFFFF